MSERFLKYETTNKDLPVDERGVLTAAGGGSSESDMIISFDDNYTRDSFKVEKGDYNTLKEKVDNGELCKVLVKMSYLYGEEMYHETFETSKVSAMTNDSSYIDIVWFSMDSGKIYKLSIDKNNNLRTLARTTESFMDEMTNIS